MAKFSCDNLHLHFRLYTQPRISKPRPSLVTEAFRLVSDEDKKVVRDWLASASQATIDEERDSVVDFLTDVAEKHGPLKHGDLTQWYIAYRRVMREEFAKAAAECVTKGD